jgi:glycerol-3-phosphate dehydrogenase
VSTVAEHDAEVTVIGAGVVGCAVALALARRGAAVALLEVEPAPALGASGTNSGILHTGFDSAPGEPETEMILTSSSIRDEVLSALRIPIVRCGAVMRPRDDSERRAVAAAAAAARRNGVKVIEGDGGLEIPAEAVTDPVVYTLALVHEARRHGAELRTDCRVAALEPDGSGMTVRASNGAAVRCRVAVNCAGLHADSVARLAGDDSFEIYPRKGEFLVFDPPDAAPLERIMLPVPSKRTRGVLVFPTVDGKIVAGPTAIDQDDKNDWSVRPQARDEILPKAASLYPPLGDASPIASYVGLRPAGRGVNYVIGRSRACERLINVAAIRSTGLTASLGIGQLVAAIVAEFGVAVGPERELKGGPAPVIDGPWWRRRAEFRTT